jgi:hypothetical protein
MNNKVVFSIDGLPIGREDKNLTYYYGLSDFWQTIFEDSDKIELLLEAQSVKLSDIYSRFLQLAGTISLTDIEIATSQQLKLVLIKEQDAVVGKVNTYKLPEQVLSARIIANRPLLPTAYLEDGVHYRISDDGTEIQFFSSINTIGFATRLVSIDDTTSDREYALWFVDSLVDEKVLYNYFGKLIGVTDQLSTERFRNFIYGLYFLRANGPNLASIRKGLNLCLGIPLARSTETVLEIRKYLDTDQYIVITDSNSYLIPYGLTPTVAIGDILEATQELAQWIEVKDYISEDEWWLNLQIPESIMPYIPDGQPDRYAKAGSYADYLMRNYLKKHTFLVNVKTIDFKNLQNFSQLSSIINEVKPSYTHPIYIWTVPTLAETLLVTDDSFTMEWQQHRCEDITVPINKFKRFLPKYTGYNKSGTQATRTFGIITNDIGTLHASGRAELVPIAPSTGSYYWEATVKDYPLHVLTPRFRVGIESGADSLDEPVGFETTGYGYEGTTRFSSFETGESWNVLDSFTVIKRDRIKSVAFNSQSGCYASTPSTVTNSIYSDIDIRVQVWFENWIQPLDRALMSKWGLAGNKREWSFELNTSSELMFHISANGTTELSSQNSGVVVPFTTGTYWVRVTRVAATGVIKYYISYDGTTWTQLGPDRTSAVGDLFQTNADINLGARDNASEHRITGRIYQAQLLNGVNGTVVSSFDSNLGYLAETTVPSTVQGEVWTINSPALLVAETSDYYLNTPQGTTEVSSTADTPANSVTGDIDLQVKVGAESYTPAVAGTLIAKYDTGSTRSYLFRLMSNGTLRLTLSQDGSTGVFATSSVALNLLAGSIWWLRATWRQSDGKVQFFTSDNGITWTQLGSDQTIAIASIADTTSPLRIGSYSTAGTEQFVGRFYQAKIKRGTNGIVASWFNAADAGVQTQGLSWTGDEATVYGPNLKKDDVVGILYNSDAGNITFYVNGVSQGVAYTGITGTIYPAISVLTPGVVIETNFGDKQFSYAVPNGANSGVYVEDTYITRDCPVFTRSTVSHFMVGQLGDDPQINGGTRLFDTGIITGYVNGVSQMRPNTVEEKAWYRAVQTRDSESYRNQRSMISFTRGNTLPDYTGLGETHYRQTDSITRKVIYLYSTTQRDLQDKFSTVGAVLPGLDTWTFSMFRTTSTGAGEINFHGINEGAITTSYFAALQSTYNTFFFRGTTYNYLGVFMPKIGYDSYAPQLGDLRDGDYLLFIRVYENTVGVYWVTSNNEINIPTFRVGEAIDAMALESDTATLHRGLIGYSSYYLIRGGGGVFSYTQGAGINESEINEGITPSPSGLTIQYSDQKNPVPLTIDRSGNVLKFRRDFK